MGGMARALFLLLLVVASAAHADDALWALLQKGGQVVLVRHAVTDPGVGDPPGFKLDDCATQRNLSAAGKAEAERLGAAIKARGVPVARVLTSPWCRCRDTARIAFGGADVDATLGNLFDAPAEPRTPGGRLSPACRGRAEAQATCSSSRMARPRSRSPASVRAPRRW